ncbi:hypothetical protein BpHYR1_042046 [Brachionus plicatilis]|uniref:Uncharacterized protein n=1 Tax=Brachionus plicatilis TaxID=10195 RepID=A0A3M7R0X8_BRAPC|nr:hypothetical protein BpHYR1_042046 [Brachionus plicatilis]
MAKKSNLTKLNVPDHKITKFCEIFVRADRYHRIICGSSTIGVLDKKFDSFQDSFLNTFSQHFSQLHSFDWPLVQIGNSISDEPLEE